MQNQNDGDDSESGEEEFYGEELPYDDEDIGEISC